MDQDNDSLIILFIIFDILLIYYFNVINKQVNISILCKMLHLFLSNNEYVIHLHCIFSFIFLFLFLGPFLCVVRTIHFERVSSLSLRKIK